MLFIEGTCTPILQTLLKCHSFKAARHALWPGRQADLGLSVGCLTGPHPPNTGLCSTWVLSSPKVQKRGASQILIVAT